MVALPQPRHSIRSGFTLVELVVTLAVAAILVAAAVPSFSAMIAANRIKRGANELQMALLTARSEAIKRNSPVRVVPSGSGASAWDGGWTVQLTDTSSTVIDRYDPVTNISIAAAGGLTDVTYRSDGRVSGTNAAKFTIGAVGAMTAATKCLYVDLSGMPYYAKPSSSGACP